MPGAARDGSHVALLEAGHQAALHVPHAQRLVVGVQPAATAWQGDVGSGGFGHVPPTRWVI